MVKRITMLQIPFNECKEVCIVSLSRPAEAVIKWSVHGLTGLTSDVGAVRLLA